MIAGAIEARSGDGADAVGLVVHAARARQGISICGFTEFGGVEVESMVLAS